MTKAMERLCTLSSGVTACLLNAGASAGRVPCTPEMIFWPFATYLVVLSFTPLISAVPIALLCLLCLAPCSFTFCLRFGFAPDSAVAWL